MARAIAGFIGVSVRVDETPALKSDENLNM
jgi:hypothetical protein